jgi:uncharacterized membrane protein YqhA
LLFILRELIFAMNKRLVIVGIILGAVVAMAFFMGSPMFEGFDMLR